MSRPWPDLPYRSLDGSLRGRDAHLQGEHLQIPLPFVLRDGALQRGHHGRRQPPRLRHGARRGGHRGAERPRHQQQAHVEHHQIAQLAPLVPQRAGHLQDDYKVVVAPEDDQCDGEDGTPADGARHREEEVVRRRRRGRGRVRLHLGASGDKRREAKPTKELAYSISLFKKSFSQSLLIQVKVKTLYAKAAEMEVEAGGWDSIRWECNCSAVKGRKRRRRTEGYRLAIGSRKGEREELSLCVLLLLPTVQYLHNVSYLYPIAVKVWYMRTQSHI